MASFLPYVIKPKRPRKKDDGEPVFIRITHNRDTLYHNTGIRIPIQDWNFTKRQMRKGAFRDKEINQFLTSEVHRARDIEIQLLGRGYKISAARLKYELSLKDGRSFAEYIQRIAEELLPDNRKLASRYRVALNFILKVRDRVSFDDLDIPFIKAVDRYLKSAIGTYGKPLSKNYSAKIHDTIKAAINRAINEGVTDIANPYKRFKITRQFVEPEFLSAEDFEKIVNVPLVGKLAQHRDFFLLATYLCGMRANELLIAKKEDIEISGSHLRLRQYISKRESHQRRVKYSGIIRRAKAIIDKYPGKYLLPYMEEDRSTAGALAKINEGLKEVSRLAGVREFSTKWARKTVINRFSEDGLPSSKIAKYVGHLSSRTTEHSYLAFDLDSQLKELERLFP